MKTETKQKDLRADLLEYKAVQNGAAPVNTHLMLRAMYIKYGVEEVETALDQYEKSIPMLLNEYKENEELNCHSENYLLLAESFGTDEDIQKAQANLDFQSKNLYADNELNKAAHDACNVYYYRYLTK